MQIKFLKIGLLLVLMCTSGLAIAQKKGKNKVSKDNTVTKSVTQEFDVDGLKVILKHSPKEIVAVRLYIKGGTANYSKEQEGIENFALNMAISGGTSKLTNIEFSTEMGKIGANVFAGSDFDFGNVGMTCVRRYFDQSWDLFAAALMDPSFSQEEFDLMKQQLITGAQQADADADSRLRNLAMSNVFEGMNYEKIPAGTVESLEKMTRDDLKNYYTKLMGKKRSFIVVVGDISKADLEKKIKASLAKLPDGDLPKAEKRIAINANPKNKVEDRDIATNYIRGYMEAPKLTDEDGVAMLLAMDILRNRYFVELRTKRSLSYAPSAFYAQGILNNPYAAVYISTTDPKQSMEVMVDEILKIKEEGFLEKELVNKKASFLTNYYMGRETLSSQAANLGMSELRGDWSMADKFTEMVNEVTLEEVNEAFKKYTNNISWTYLGDVDLVEDADFGQPVKP